MDKFTIMEQIRIKVLDFTENPGPRYIRQDKIGESNSGEAFYLQTLNEAFTQAYRDNKQLVLELDGVSGYPSSFLDEAIGELVFDFTLEIVEKHIDFDTHMYKRRVAQVKEETYPQWEERRKKKDIVVHSSGVNNEIYYINENGELKQRVLYGNS